VAEEKPLKEVIIVKISTNLSELCLPRRQTSLVKSLILYAFVKFEHHSFWFDLATR
jgi:hypothetical protein